MGNTASSSNRRPYREGGPTVIPGRTGGTWRRCRAQVIRESGDVCAICSGWIDSTLPKSLPASGEVDHITPLRRLKEMYPDPVEYAAHANDPHGCRYVHRRCHEDRGEGITRSSRRTRSPEWGDDIEPKSLDGVHTGDPHAYDLNEVVARLEASNRGNPRYRTTTAQPVHAGIGIG
jgi:hypothetical protein